MPSRHVIVRHVELAHTHLLQYMGTVGLLDRTPLNSIYSCSVLVKPEDHELSPVPLLRYVCPTCLDSPSADLYSSHAFSNARTFTLCQGMFSVRSALCLSSRWKYRHRTPPVDVITQTNIFAAAAPARGLSALDRSPSVGLTAVRPRPDSLKLHSVHVDPSTRRRKSRPRPSVRSTIQLVRRASPKLRSSNTHQSFAPRAN